MITERPGRGRGGARWPAGDPFAALGLEPAPELTDEDVRAAWRRIAAATHPDHADGGDPVRFALAAAAYAELRTSDGRSQARSRLEHARSPWRYAARILPRGVGRQIRLTARVLATAGVAMVALMAAGHDPAGPALVAGAVTWLLVTARRDIAAKGDLPSGASGQRGQPRSGPVATGLAGSADQADQDPT